MNGLTFPSAYKARQDYTYMADDGEVTITDNMLKNDIAVIKVTNNYVYSGGDYWKTFVNNTSTPLLVGISDENTTVGTAEKSNFFGICVSASGSFNYKPCNEIKFVPQGGEFDVKVTSETGEQEECYRYAFCVSVGIPYFAKGES